MEQLIADYAGAYEAIAKAVEGASEELLSFKPAPDKWSIKEIVIHLADTEIVVVHRLKSVIAEEKPPLPAFDQDDWAKRLNYASQDMRMHLALFKLLRESMVPVLRQLKEEDWSRAGIHSEAGELTLKELLRRYTEHVHVHLRQIDRVKAAFAERR